MADYPDYTQVVGSRFDAEDGTVLERAESGRARLRSYFVDVEQEAEIVHEVDGPEKDAIWQHYLEHRMEAFNFLYRGDMQNYVVRYVRPPERVPIAGTDRWRVVSYFVVA